MRAQGILRFGFVMALGMVAATIGCGDDTGPTKDGGTDVPKTDGGTGGKTDGGTGGKADGGGGAAGQTDGGGAAGSDGGTTTDGGSSPQVLFDFTSNATGWGVNAGITNGNLGLLEAGTVGTVKWVSTGGNPGGALEIFAPFTDTAQQTPSSYVYSTALTGTTGKKLTIGFKVTQVLPASLQWVAAVQVMTNTSAWASAGNKWCSIPANTNWGTCVVDLTGADLKQIMIHLVTGSPMPDAGVPEGDVTVLIDNITLE